MKEREKWAQAASAPCKCRWTSGALSEQDKRRLCSLTQNTHIYSVFECSERAHALTIVHIPHARRVITGRAHQAPYPSRRLWARREQVELALHKRVAFNDRGEHLSRRELDRCVSRLGREQKNGRQTRMRVQLCTQFRNAVWWMDSIRTSKASLALMLLSDK